MSEEKQSKKQVAIGENIFQVQDGKVEYHGVQDTPRELPNIGPVINAYLLDHPLLERGSVLTELRRLLSSGRLRCNPARLGLMKRATPLRSFSALDVLDVVGGVFIRFVIRAQVDESYLTKSKGLGVAGKPYVHRMYRDDLPRIPTWENHLEIRVVSGTSKATKCPHCNGKGYLESPFQRPCSFCTGGTIWSHLKRVRRVYALVFPFQEMLLINPSLKCKKPPKYLDVLWESSIEDEPFDTLPFATDMSFVMRGEDRCAPDLHNAFKKVMIDIMHRVERKEIKLDRLEQPDDSDTVLEIAKAFGVAKGILDGEGPPQVEAVSANHFQVAIEATPIYRVMYERTVKHTSGFWFWKKTRPIVLEGEIHLQGKKSLRSFYHEEQKLS